jgi:hypothetical protein
MHCKETNAKVVFGREFADRDTEWTHYPPGLHTDLSTFRPGGIKYLIAATYLWFTACLPANSLHSLTQAIGDLHTVLQDVQGITKQAVQSIKPKYKKQAQPHPADLQATLARPKDPYQYLQKYPRSTQRKFLPSCLDPSIPCKGPLVHMLHVRANTLSVSLPELSILHLLTNALSPEPPRFSPLPTSSWLASGGSGGGACARLRCVAEEPSGKWFTTAYHYVYCFRENYTISVVSGMVCCEPQVAARVQAETFSCTACYTPHVT